MKENEDLNLKNILRKRRNSPMKVILNGGKRELNQATIPFQIGFDSNIASLNPSCVLVIDVTKNSYGNNGIRCLDDCISDRTLFKLEPINYLQLHESGIHHLVFILLKDIDRDTQRYLLQKEMHSSWYDRSIFWDDIEKNESSWHISYVEMIINVSEQLFAPKPKTKFKKAIHHWVNSWYTVKNVDPCLFKKRVPFAFTIKPMLWLLGFFLRFIILSILQAVMFVIRIGAFFFGLQPVKFFPKFKKLWFDFLFLYPLQGYEEVFDFKENWFGKCEKDNENDFYDYKELVIKGQKYYSPVTLCGLVFYSSFFGLYTYIIYRYWSDGNPLSSTDRFLSLFLLLCISLFLALIMAGITLPTIKDDHKWQRRWDKELYQHGRVNKGEYLRKRVGYAIFIFLSSIASMSFLVTQIKWVRIVQSKTVHINPDFLLRTLTILFIAVILYFLIYKIAVSIYKKIEIWISKMESGKSVIVKKKYEKHQEWLRKSFNINNLPKKVAIKTMPKPSNFVHYFRVGFWFAKSKVCRPYARK